MEKLNYKVWAMRHGSSAKNKVMIGISPSRVELEHLDPYRWRCFEFEAMTDHYAEQEIIKLINEWTPTDNRTIAGLSYLRHCRPSLRVRKQ